MSQKHTPGSWVIDTNDNLIHANDARHTIVCSFAATLRNPSVMADARLIAAAPDMLEALKLCASVVAGNTMHKQGLVDALAAARAALFKATGERQ
jgi:hypothetical protein